MIVWWLGLGVFGAYVTAISSHLVWGAVWGLSVSLIAWLFAFRPRVEFSGTTIRVTNPWGRYVVDAQQVASVESGYDGLLLRLRDGSKRKIWAVQRSNFSALAGRENRSDRVAAELTEAVNGA